MYLTCYQIFQFSFYTVEQMPTPHLCLHSTKVVKPSIMKRICNSLNFNLTNVISRATNNFRSQLVNLTNVYPILNSLLSYHPTFLVLLCLHWSKVWSQLDQIILSEPGPRLILFPIHVKQPIISPIPSFAHLQQN